MPLPDPAKRGMDRETWNGEYRLPLRNLVAMFAVCVLVCAGIGFVQWQRLGEPGPSVAVPQPTTADVPAPSEPRRRGFDSTPMASWGGVDELPFPVPAATAHFGEREVAEALERVRAVMALGRTRWTGTPEQAEELTGMFAVNARAQVRVMLNANPVEYASLAPLGRSYAADVRVNGTVAVEEGSGWKGRPSLTVSAELTWAYVFDLPDGYDGDTVLLLRNASIWRFTAAGGLTPDDAGMWPMGSFSATVNGDCGIVADGGLIATPNAPDDRVTGPRDAQSRIDWDAAAAGRWKALPCR